MTDQTQPDPSTPAEPESFEQTAARLEAASAPSTPATSAKNLPTERLGRGLLFSLVIIPAGIILWVLIWQLGFISALVAFAVVIGATFMYRLGSGGRISLRGLIVIVAVTLVTLVLAFLSGMAADLAAFLDISLLSAIGNADFWDTFALNVFDNPALWADYTPTILISLAFAALGTFSVFRSVSQEARSSAA